MPIQITDNTDNIDIKSISHSEINAIMMGLYTLKRVLENRTKNDKADISAKNELTKIDALINQIDSQYTNWKGNAISLLDNNLADTLTNNKIWDNKITIL